MSDKWDYEFVEGTRLNGLGRSDKDRVRKIVNAADAPEGRELVVMYGIDGGAPWLCGGGLSDFDDSWRETCCEDDHGDGGPTVDIRIGHAPLGWASSLPEFGGF